MQRRRGSDRPSGGRPRRTHRVDGQRRPRRRQVDERDHRWQLFIQRADDEPRTASTRDAAPDSGPGARSSSRRLEARGATRRRRRSGRGTSAAARLRTTGPSASPAQPHPRRLPGRQRSPRDNAPHGARAPGARPRYDHCRRERPDLLAHGLLSHVQLVRRVPAFASLRASPWRRVRRSPQTKPESAVPRECRHPHSLEGGRAPACLPRLLQRVPCGGSDGRRRKPSRLAHGGNGLGRRGVAIQTLLRLIVHRSSEEGVETSDHHARGCNSRLRTVAGRSRREGC
jgi:hypothetical protein